MAAPELHYATIRELGEQFRRRTLSPVELTGALLERIEKLDPTLRAFVTVTAERARADARAAEAALRAGHAGPLLGIPVAYKDLYATKGILTTAGSAVLADCMTAPFTRVVSRSAEGSSSVSTTGPRGAKVSCPFPMSSVPNALSLRWTTRSLTSLPQV